MARMVIFTASYPDVSPSRWKFARKGRREGENGRGFCLSSFSVPWSIALRQQSLAFSRFKALCEKRSVWGGSSYCYISTFFFFLSLFQFCIYGGPQGPWQHLTEAWMNELSHRDNDHAFDRERNANSMTNFFISSWTLCGKVIFTIPT